MAKRPLRELGYITTAMYKAPHDPVVDHVMRTRREAHIGGSSIRDDDVKGLLKLSGVSFAQQQRMREQRERRRAMNVVTEA